MKRFLIHGGIFISIMVTVAVAVFFIASQYESPETGFTVAEAKDEEEAYIDILTLLDDASIEGIRKDLQKMRIHEIDEGFIELEQFFGE